MNLDVKLNVTPEELYDAILESVAAEITHVTNKKTKPKQLKKGMSYTKPVSKSRTMHVTITKLTYPLEYAIRCESANGVHIISYELEELEDGVGVSYNETVENLIGKNSENALQRLWANMFGRKKVIKMLQKLEAYIIMNREKLEETETTSTEEE